MPAQTTPLIAAPFRLTTHVWDPSVEHDTELGSSLDPFDVLEYTIWEDAGITDYLCPYVTDADIDKILTKLDKKTLPYQYTEPWDIGATQRDVYCPLVQWFQDEVIQAISSSIGLDKDYALGSVEFHVWNPPDTIVPDEELSYFGTPLDEDVWMQLMRQASTYASSILEAHKNWNCVPIVMFNQVSGVFKFGFQNRIGLVVTTEMSLSDTKDFRRLIKAFVCLTKWTPALADSSHSQRHFSFGRLGQYWVQNTISSRLNLLGVYSRVLFQHIDSGDPILEPLILPSTFSTCHKQHPPYLIHRPSCQPDNRYTEGAMLQSVRGEWGVPCKLDAFSVKDKDGLVIETDRFHCDRTAFGDTLLPEEKVTLSESDQQSMFLDHRLYGLFRNTAGKGLESAETVAEMLRGLLDGMLEHYILYSSGWLHKDVSGSNILLLKTSEDRKQEGLKYILPANVSLGNCTGMIIDGDRAVRWNEERDISIYSRLGTLPFLSMRIIDTWHYYGMPVFHTAIDDLESFIWVLLISVLQWCSLQPGGMTMREQKVYDKLHTSDLENLLLQKSSLVSNIEDTLDGWSQTILAVLPLLRNWNTLAREYWRKVTQHYKSEGKSQDLQTLCVEAYKAYLEEGFKGLELLSDDQPHLMNA